MPVFYRVKKKRIIQQLEDMFRILFSHVENISHSITALNSHLLKWPTGDFKCFLQSPSITVVASHIIVHLNLHFRSKQTNIFIFSCVKNFGIAQKYLEIF